MGYREESVPQIVHLCPNLYWRPSFRENKTKTLVFNHWKRSFWPWACFRENWVSGTALFKGKITNALPSTFVYGFIHACKLSFNPYCNPAPFKCFFYRRYCPAESHKMGDTYVFFLKFVARKDIKSITQHLPSLVSLPFFLECVLFCVRLYPWRLPAGGRSIVIDIFTHIFPSKLVSSLIM